VSFGQEMHLKIPFLSRGLKFPNYKPKVVECGLFISLRNRYLHCWLPDIIKLIQISAFFWLLIPGLNPVSIAA
jgi:hypothetical protein